MSDTGRRMRCLVLGGGAVVAEFYLPALAQLGWLEDTWVADPSPAAIARLKARWPALHEIVGGIDEGLAVARAERLDGVIVAAPNALHEAAVTAALAAGFDVLCEKPLALTAEGCERLGREAETRGRILAVGMTRRFTPSLRAVRAALAAGWIGDVREVHAEDGYQFAWATESGRYFRRDNGGVLANLGVHTLDTLRFLLGELTPEDYHDDYGGGVEANATLLLRTAQGVPVRTRFSYTHALKNDIVVRGARGEIRASHDSPDATFVSTETGLRASVVADPAYTSGQWPTTFGSAFIDEFADFRDAVRDRRPPAATAEDASASARLIDWAMRTRASRPRVSVVRTASLAPGRVVVTGGTGFVGGHLVEALAGSDRHQLVVPVRSHRSGANAGRFAVELTRADLLNRADLDRLCAGAKYVFHLAYGRDGQDARRVTIEGTQQVVEAAIAAGVEAVVVVSSTSVFGNEGGATPLDETAPLRPPNRDYERTKAEAERWTLDRARSVSGTRVVVCSPSCVYGPGGKTFIELPAQMLRANAFAWIEDGRGLTNYVYVENLVNGLIAAAASPDAHGERFILSDGWISWRGFYEGLFGDLVAHVPSYTGDELQAAVESARPTLKDLGRSIVRNPEMWRVVRENRRLAGSKALVERLTPAVYRRVKAARHGSPPAAGTSAPARSLPPLYFVDLFGPASTKLSADKARTRLQWHSPVSLGDGLSRSREWLKDIGAWPGEDAR